MDLQTTMERFIIPYQELPGNYNNRRIRRSCDAIIPYQELPGNYNIRPRWCEKIAIIPYQELPGNYNFAEQEQLIGGDYTIPRTTRELQPLRYGGE